MGRRTAAKLVMPFAAIVMLIAVPAASATHARPKGGSPLRASLVPAYDPCVAPDRTHGPPLAFNRRAPHPPRSPTASRSGNPPAGSANFIGSWTLNVTVGVPGPPEDSCAPNSASITDVRCKGMSGGCAAAGADYTGEVEVRIAARITDHWNAVAAGGGPSRQPSRTIDLRIPAICTATADPNVGGTCSINTDLNVVYPGSIKDTKREIIEVGQVAGHRRGRRRRHATADGEATFLTQGVFIP